MRIYMIAGPPGIGKSTHSKALIPVGTPIVDHVLASYQYKRLGFDDYKDIASKRCNERVREFLMNKEDFALELNLGFSSHYDYLTYISRFHRDNQVELILFFTDDIKLCLNRADIRHRSGGHQVLPFVIENMYKNTISLFKQNKHIFSSIRMIDVSYDSITELTPDVKVMPKWITENNLRIYI